jgi:hypothetical protein
MSFISVTDLKALIASNPLQIRIFDSSVGPDDSAIDFSREHIPFAKFLDLKLVRDF